MIAIIPEEGALNPGPALRVSEKDKSTMSEKNWWGKYRAVTLTFYHAKYSDTVKPVLSRHSKWRPK